MAEQQASVDDELLAVLLVNLRNAAATFGEGTAPYESIKTTVQEHVRSMQAQGRKTNLTQLRHRLDALDVDHGTPTTTSQQPLDKLFAGLALESDAS
ncbi:hypothetical protein Tdes44962_MAKER06948 [Teratosphaeria destructans]|uniref:Uncharacterized protein n=1 Tax=Teratosphaeria destructans TaxID=418781 RepID=A0A9W7T0H7_9PEZI|nr:hypothetical protein Tdes44962_MAKER06948 [Teratosphaeria destructans]